MWYRCLELQHSGNQCRVHNNFKTLPQKVLTEPAYAHLAMFTSSTLGVWYTLSDAQWFLIRGHLPKGMSFLQRPGEKTVPQDYSHQCCCVANTQRKQWNMFFQLSLSPTIAHLPHNLRNKHIFCAPLCPIPISFLVFPPFGMVSPELLTIACIW